MTENTRESERKVETVVPEKPISVVRSRPFRACSPCRLARCRCRHNREDNRAHEPFIEPARLSGVQDHISRDPGDILARISRPAAEEIEKCMRPSVIRSRVLARQNEAKLQSGSDPKTPNCQNEARPMNVMPLGRNRRSACVSCRKAKSRCIHHSDGEEDSERTMEPAVPRPHARKAYIKDGIESTPMKTMVMQEVSPKHTSRLRSSEPRVSASQTDNKPTLSAENVAETRLGKSGASHSEVPTSELGRPVRTRHVRQDVKKKHPTVSSRRPPLLYGPQDDIALLHICVYLKDMVEWGTIADFWTMVRENLEIETGKSCSNKQVRRHVKVLADNRCAEQCEIEQKGKLSKPRVSAECRSLLDTWNAGGNRIANVSTRTSTTPSSVEDENDVSLNEHREQGLETDTSALEAQKRSATDAWLDTSCETTSSKRLRLGSSELISSTNKSSTENYRSWSVSGSSVTSESSIGDDSEDEDKEIHDMDKGG